MKRRRGCLIFFLVLAVLALAAWLILRQPAQKTAEDVSPHIAQVTHRPDLPLTYEGRETVAFGKVDSYSAQLGDGDPVTFEVEPETGAVRSFARYEQPSGTVDVDLATAQAAAVSFAASIGGSQTLLGGQPVQAELIDHGAGSAKYYSFWWVRTDSQSGAILPQEIRVRVNAQTGEVDSYSGLDVQVTVSTTPAVTREQAVEIALAAAQGMEAPAAVGVTLFVSTVPVFEPGGTQALLWAVGVEGQADDTGYVPGVTVFIDAQTGEAVHVSQTM